MGTFTFKRNGPAIAARVNCIINEGEPRARKTRVTDAS